MEEEDRGKRYHYALRIVLMNLIEYVKKSANYK